MIRAALLCKFCVLFFAFTVAGCGGSGGDDRDDRQTVTLPDLTKRTGTGFERLATPADGSLTLGDPPITATFRGGTVEETRLAHTGDWAWTVEEGDEADIVFSTPLTELVLWFTNENESQIIIPPARSARAQAVCGIQDQGLDNSEFFGTTVFTRGSFNDWGNSGLEPQYQFVNFGEGVFNAQFEFEEEDSYEFKIADGGWAIEYGNPDEDFTLDVPVRMSGGASLGGANSTVVIPEPGCYNFEITIIDDSGTPPPVADLLLTFVEIDPGAATLAQSFVRVFDETGEEIAVFEGVDEYQRIEVIRLVSETGIGRVEVVSLLGDENTTGIGQVAIDDFRFGAVEDTVPRTLSVYYSKPDGDYSATRIEVETSTGTATYDCLPTTDNAFGCVVQFAALGGYDVTYTVFNDGVPDAGGPITFAVNDATDNNIYTFAGSNVPVLADLPALPLNDNEVVLYYFRPDGQYDGFGLHLFPDGSPTWTVFTGGEYPFAGIDEDYGAWFIIALPGSDRLTAPYSNDPAPVDDFPARLGFIIHKGDEKDPGPDQFIEIAEDGNVIFVTSGVVSIGTTPPTPGAVNVIGAAAHWVAEDTLLWDAGGEVASVQLLHSTSASITTAGTALIGEDGVFELTAGANPLSANGDSRHLAALPAFTLPAEAVAADLVGDQLVAVGLNAGGERIAATAVQIPLVLDALYAEAAADVELGVTFDADAPTVRVWAPTANSVVLNLYTDPASDAPSATEDMEFDPASGVWSVTGQSSWNRMYYTFGVNVYAPGVGAVVDNVVTDPYSFSLSTGSATDRLVKSQIVNFKDADLRPEDWDALAKPPLAAPEDIVLYELHVRDFSIWDQSVPAADRGKYTAFAGDGSGVQHLSAMADAGLTHVHVLPSFDIATVNEDATQRVEITAPVEDLCAANLSAASLCVDYPGMTIEDIMAAQPGDGALQQQIVEWIKDLDGFNWGYDPFHYTVPEGSYSTNPEGAVRIREFRTMVKGLSDIGLRTVMDVVYNHTNAAGNVSDKSVLDRIVPGYYHRQDETLGIVLQDSCCQDTASEHAMMEKLMIDSLVTWAREYKVDGFRFDIMGFHSTSTLEKAQDALQSLTFASDGVDGSKIYLYGEGWNFGDVQDDRRFEQATQANVAGTGIGTFNDRIRDSVRGGGPFDSGVAHVRNQGFVNGQFYDPNAQNSGATAELNALLGAADLIRLSMAGNLKSYELVNSAGDTLRGDQVFYAGQMAGYTEDPQEIVNYAASHDGETLWDIGAYKHPADATAEERVRAQNVANSILLLGQGIPFMHAGQDMLRSKSMDRNSFDSGDWFNRLDFTYSDNNFAVGEPRNSENQSSLAQIGEALQNPLADPAMADILAAATHTREMLEIRAGSRLFRLREAGQIVERVSYHNTGPDQVPGLIVQSITDGEACTGSNLDANYSRAVTIVNASTTDQTFELFPAGAFDLHLILQDSADPVVRSAAHSAAGFFVPARTTAVFVEADEPVDCGPFGVDVYLRFFANSFEVLETSRFDLRNSDTAQVTVALESALAFFRVADDEFEFTDCGASVSGVGATLNQPFTMSCGEGVQSIQLDLRSQPAGDYVFSLDASDPAAPIVTVTSADLDLVPPTVTITEPLDDDVLAGSVVIRAEASDNFEVVTTRFFVDGLLIGADTTPQGNQYSVTWDSTSVADGGHVLSVEAEDSSGNVGTSGDVSIMVDSTLLDDDSPPVVALDPVASPLSATVTLSAEASDPQGGLEMPTGVVEVRFYYDAVAGDDDPVLIDSTSSEPFSVSWDTTTVGNGDYEIFAEAIDGAGNLAMSDVQATTVENSGTYGEPVFVCGVGLGDCVGGAPAPQFELEFAGNDTFVGTLALMGIRYAFRMEDVGSGVDIDIDCGSESLYTPVVPGTPFDLGCASGSNAAQLDLRYEGAGDYVFVLDASASALNPILTVSPAAAPPDGASGDVTPPTVEVTGVMSGLEPQEPWYQVVSAIASDTQSPIARVEFFIDDAVQPFWTDTTAPYQAPWNSQAVANGEHDLTARAVDAAGNAAISLPFTVSVDNDGPYGVGIYTRGSWNPPASLVLSDQPPMAYLGSGVYRETLPGMLNNGNPDTPPTITGTTRFKIADDSPGFDNPDTDCNPEIDKTPAILGQPLEFLCDLAPGDAKLDVSLEEPTDYTFTLDASRGKVRPFVTVTRAAPGPDPVPGDITGPRITALDTEVPNPDLAFIYTITATVTDDALDPDAVDGVVESVTFAVDGQVIWADFTVPYEAPWDSSLFENGTRTITAIATDANGNIGSSDPLDVIIANPDFGPFDKPMYVRGAFTTDSDLNFGTTHQLQLLEEGGSVYEAIVFIDANPGLIPFKVADADYAEGTNCGQAAGQPAFTPLGATVTLVCSIADNNNETTPNINPIITVQPADYKFTVDASGFPDTPPTVTVTAVP